MDSDELEFLKQLQEEFVEKFEEVYVALVEIMAHYETSTESSDLTKFLQSLHSLKGSATAVGFEDIATEIHRIEQIVQDKKVKKDVSTTEFVDEVKLGIHNLNDMLRNRG